MPRVGFHAFIQDKKLVPLRADPHLLPQQARQGQLLLVSLLEVFLHFLIIF